MAVKGRKDRTVSANELQGGGKITVRTAEERKYADMLLDVLRGVNEQWKHSLMMTIVSAHQHCNEKRALDTSCLKMLDESEKRQVREEPEKQQTRKTLREKMDEFDSDAINTLEYGFHYVNGVLATTQRITEGETEEEKTLGKGTEQIIRKTLKEFKKDHGNITKEMREGIIKGIEYQNSLEGILCRMHTWIDATGEDDKGKLGIAKTLLKLPYKVREKVLDDKVAFLFSSLHGTALEISFPMVVRKSEFEKIGGISEDYIYEHKQPVIFLNLPPKTKEAEMMTTVAHEIAHFILGHHKTPGMGNIYQKEREERTERDADDLCEKWGFGRAYKSYNPLTPR